MSLFSTVPAPLRKRKSQSVNMNPIDHPLLKVHPGNGELNGTLPSNDREAGLSQCKAITLCGIAFCIYLLWIFSIGTIPFIDFKLILIGAPE